MRNFYRTGLVTLVICSGCGGGGASTETVSATTDTSPGTTASTGLAGLAGTTGNTGTTGTAGTTGVTGATGPATLDLSAWNSALWTRSDNYTNGGAFNVGWRADHAVGDDGGVLTLTIDDDAGHCPAGCAMKPYAAGQMQSASTYRYGTYQVDMQTSNAVGTVTSFFTYVDPKDDGTNDEIDVEIPGERSTTLEMTYYRHGGSGVEHTGQLGFDASAAFHTYAIRWLPDSITWFVDGQTFYTATGSPTTLPTVSSYFMLNFWTGSPDWLGMFNYVAPVQALYRNPTFTPAE